jgi:hypothetical protein
VFPQNGCKQSLLHRDGLAMRALPTRYSSYLGVKTCIAQAHAASINSCSKPLERRTLAFNSLSNAIQPLRSRSGGS